MVFQRGGGWKPKKSGKLRQRTVGTPGHCRGREWGDTAGAENCGSREHCKGSIFPNLPKDKVHFYSCYIRELAARCLHLESFPDGWKDQKYLLQTGAEWGQEGLESLRSLSHSPITNLWSFFYSFINSQLLTSTPDLNAARTRALKWHESCQEKNIQKRLMNTTPHPHPLPTTRASESWVSWAVSW